MIFFTPHLQAFTSSNGATSRFRCVWMYLLYRLFMVLFDPQSGLHWLWQDCKCHSTIAASAGNLTNTSYLPFSRRKRTNHAGAEQAIDNDV